MRDIFGASLRRRCRAFASGARHGAFMLAAAALVGCAGQSEPLTPEAADARNRAAIHTELGGGYYSRGQLGVALEELNEALRADPTYAPAYNVLGLVYMGLREDEQAVRNFERALSLSPGDSDTHNNYGWYLCQRNRVDESIKHFMAAVKNPLYATPEKSYANAGACLLKQNDLAGAEDFFNRALQLQPQNAQALYSLADISHRQGKYPEARAYLARLARVAQPTADSLWLGARVEHKLGDRNAETSYGMQLKSQFPDSPQAQMYQAGKYE